MICRFCGKKTNTNEKCGCCSKESPVLLEYKSYGNDSVVEKLSLLLEVYDKKDSVEVMEKDVIIPENFIEEKNNNGRRTKKSHSEIVTACILVFIGVLIYVFTLVNNNKEHEIYDEPLITETTTVTSEVTINIETSDITTTATVTDIPDVAGNTSFEGNYYSINDSVFSDKSVSDFINIFGVEPVFCSKEMHLSEDTIDYNERSYNVRVDDNVIKLKYTNFERIDEKFVKSFNFNEITQSDEYYNTDIKQNEFYAFDINGYKVNATVLCIKLKDLYYGGTVKKYDILEGLCLFSISNNGKDSVLWIKDKNDNICIKSSYRNSYGELENSSGEIFKSNGGYEIARLSLDGEKDIFFYHELESQDIYMIQYIRYNTGDKGISDAVLRE